LDIPSHLDLVHPDVHLDPDSLFANEKVWKARILNQHVEAQVADLRNFVIWALAELPKALNRDKVTALKELNSQWKDFLVVNQSHLPEDYLFFGPESLQTIGDETLADLKNIISLFFKTNAFYTSALTADVNGQLSIRSVDGDSYYAKVIRTIDSAYLLIDAELTNDFEISSYQVYTVSNGVKTNVDVTELEAHQILIVLLHYYAQCIHTNLHTFQYIMGSALAQAADKNVATLAFATPYIFNLASTYTAVVDLDLRVGGVLVGGLFRADRDALLGVLREMMVTWGKCKTSKHFIDRFLFSGFPDKNLPRELGILEEFRKHSEIITEFADAINDYMRPNVRYELMRVNHRLKNFLSSTGSGLSRISYLKDWIELMSVTGLMHGQTLSFTRFMATNVAYKAISPQETFTMFDLGYWRATAPTIIGAQMGRSVMESSMYENESPYFDPDLVEIIHDYTVKANNLKKEYYDQVKSEGLISDYGWILSDFFPEGFDGRQLTVTTYF
jgi:hypothetical protein